MLSRKRVERNLFLHFRKATPFATRITLRATRFPDDILIPRKITPEFPRSKIELRKSENIRATRCEYEIL